MPLPTPIKLTLYKPNNDVYKELITTFVPWKLMKKAIAVTKLPGFQDTSKLDEADADAIAGLVVDLFSGEVTLNELDEHADMGDMITTIQSIVSRAHGVISQNPTPPSSKKKSR